MRKYISNYVDAVVFFGNLQSIVISIFICAKHNSTKVNEANLKSTTATEAAKNARYTIPNQMQSLVVFLSLFWENEIILKCTWILHAIHF